MPLNTFKKLENALQTVIFERNDAIHASLAAMAAGRHIFALGPPGTAKSYLVSQIASRINGASVFDILMTKFTKPEEIFGPLKLSALEQDRYEYASDGYLPTANFAFLDETFKASSAILNALLRVLNERTFGTGAARQTIPLITCFGASNELPQGEELAALYDRFDVRVVVDRLKDPAAFEAMLTNGHAAPTPILTLAEISSAQQATAAVKVDKDVLDSIYKLRKELDGAGISSSDRRYKNALSLVKAEAWLNGASQASTEHLLILQHVLWQEPAQIAAVRRHVIAVSNPVAEKALSALDETKNTWDAFVSISKDSKIPESDKTKAAQDAHATIKKLLKNIQEESNKHPNNAKIAKAFKEAKEVQSQLVNDYLIGTL